MRAGGRGVPPGRPAARAWTAAPYLDRAACCGPLNAKHGGVLGLEMWEPAHLRGCNEA